MRLNKWVRVLLTIYTIILSSYYFIIRDTKEAIGILVFIPIIYVPVLFRKIFKKKVVYYVEFLYYLFTTLAVLFGLSLHFYKTIPLYDVLVHFIWGILIAFVGVLIYHEVNYENKNKLIFPYIIFFCLIFSMATSSIWEVIEFTYDNLFNGNMQRVETGVYDTMKDIIVHLNGTLLFILWYKLLCTKKDHELISKGIIEK